MERQLKAIQVGSNAASLPLIWAHSGKINNEFGFRRNPFGGRTYEFHAGMDIDGERGDMVVAPAGGVVTEAGWKGGYGQMVEIDHGNGLKPGTATFQGSASTPRHVDPRPVLARWLNRPFHRPHLHYELRLNDRPSTRDGFYRPSRWS